MKRLISLAILLIYINMLTGCSKQTILHRSDMFPDDYNKIVAVVKVDADRDINFDDKGGRFDKITRLIEGRTVEGEDVSYLVDSLGFVIVEIYEPDTAFTVRYPARKFITTHLKQVRKSKFKKILAVNLLNGDQVTFNITGGKLSLDKRTVYGDNENWLPVEIPIDSVVSAQVVQSDPTTTVIILMSLGAAVALAMIASADSDDDNGEWEIHKEGGDPRFGSCPLVYSFDGSDHHLDAQPLSGAICPAMKRSEISALENIRPVDGKYRLMITNVLHETEYLDNISLFYIDHPDNHRVVYDLQENPYHIGKIHSPVAAVDEAENDILSFVEESDGIAYRSRMPLDTLKPPTIDRHQLTFKFIKPQDAESGLLVYNAGTSFWASRMVREFLQLRGSQLPKWFDALGESEQEMKNLRDLLKRDQSYLLQVEVGEEDEFQQQGYIRYGGPLAIEDRAMRLDLSHVAGDTVTIKLNPPFGFWTVDYIGMAWDEYEMPEPHYFEFVSATDNNNLDVRPVLESRNDVYYEMPNTGDYFDAEFESPDTEAEPGMKRSVFIQMSGYYSLHFDLTAAPQTDRLEYLENTPGAAIELSIEEYMESLAAAYKMP